MLVVSRKIGEAILVGHNISVTVVRIGSGIVRIGIDSSDDASVVRREFEDSRALCVTVGAEPPDDKPIAESVP